VRLGDQEFVLADLPGLIEGASEGVGVGTRFLGHVERCSVILHLVDATLDDVAGAYCVIREELSRYGHGLAEKPEIVGLNKIDAIDPERVNAKRRDLFHVAQGDSEVLPLSGATGANVADVLAALLSIVSGQRHGEASTEAVMKPLVHNP